MARRSWLAVGLVVLLAGCGDDRPGAQQRSASKRAPRPICGYSGTAANSIPAEAAQVLPGRAVALSTENSADGSFRVVTLVDLPFNQAFNAILARAQTNGWAVEGREKEIRDAELELTRNTQRLTLALALSEIPGCVATHVEVVFTPQE